MKSEGDLGLEKEIEEDGLLGITNMGRRRTVAD
jgi:hypothetical protein